MRNILIIDVQFGAALRSNSDAHVIRFNPKLNTPQGLLIRASNVIAGRVCNRLEILAHGMYFGERYSEPYMSLDTSSYGGFGINLGTPKVTIYNVNMFSILKDKVRNIILDCCGVANTQPLYRGSFGDGQLLCSKIAQHSGATVYAADEAQSGSGRRTVNNMHNEWRGNVYRFNPDGTFNLYGGNFSEFIE